MNSNRTLQTLFISLIAIGALLSLGRLSREKASPRAFETNAVVRTDSAMLISAAIPPRRIAKPLPHADSRAWKPDDYTIVDALPGVVAVKKSDKVVYAAFKDLLWHHCDGALCIQFPNEQNVIVGEELRKHLPQGMLYAMLNKHRQVTIESGGSR